MSEGKGGWVQTLRNRNFALLWLGQAISQLGDWVLFAVLPVWTYQLTGSKTVLGTMMVFQTLPVLLFGPVAGVLVDRWNRKRVMIVCDVLRGLIILGLFLVRSAEQVCLIYLIGFLNATLGRLFIPAKNASIPNLVGKDQLLAANSLSSATQTLTMLIGPAIGGALIGWAGPGPAFWFDAVSFFISALAIIFIALPHRVEEKRPVNIPLIYRDLLAGFRLIRQNPVLSSVLLLWAIVMFGGGAINVLAVVFITETLQLPSSAFGLALSSQGFGTKGAPKSPLGRSRLTFQRRLLDDSGIKAPKPPLGRNRLTSGGCDLGCQSFRGENQKGP